MNIQGGGPGFKLSLAFAISIRGPPFSVTSIAKRLRGGKGRLGTQAWNYVAGITPILYYLPMKRLPLAIPIILLLSCYVSGQSAVDLGVNHDGMYINRGFGFSFKYPKDWVVHGEATNERIREIGSEKIAESGALSRASLEVALKNTYHFLTVFRHPLGTPGITVNPAILVMAERVAHAPGIVSGKEYLLNVRALIARAGAEALLKEDPIEYRYGGAQFFRDNYAIDVNGRHMVQTYFAHVTNGYAIVFIFMNEDQKSVDEMAKAMETFSVLPRKGVTTIRSSASQRKRN